MREMNQVGVLTCKCTYAEEGRVIGTVLVRTYLMQKLEMRKPAKSCEVYVHINVADPLLRIVDGRERRRICVHQAVVIRSDFERHRIPCG